eukprot:6935569-Alexandrium_andersonii.AAC.1
MCLARCQVRPDFKDRGHRSKCNKGATRDRLLRAFFWCPASSGCGDQARRPAEPREQNPNRNG